MLIRPLEKDDDRLAISRIYEESWKAAYRDIIPEEYLASIPPGRWAPYLDAEGRQSLVLLEDGAYIGTASYARSRTDLLRDYGEIISLYLLPESMGKGYGKKLLSAAIDALSSLGNRDLFLWVLEENQRARRFYEKAGFVPSGDFLEACIGGKDLREVQYRYHIG
ncbi:GNAT family N-acetyltransferase [Akkermansia muciniphila]|uniref:GNAT family N-acetyltransferase n=1 Tax=Akkermansia muciniphila TaxID=239935 RepID=UPI00122F02A0|nr:GNAT family N-acetyltransferase [Akkermansia muciniphila]KAA3384440.1 GNAT family N-acetyltransferase [Akkermansia muciniphila]